ncbi:hypothetical protein HRS9122_09526 [Pyrenophora teres f. teres]|nr:hypothetical protein HRS9122_09526 [Pyrenophora teres f. teres]KAE8857537.1 hypothetical protein PTNB29_08604 [Pyrenophora teres f. teres]
MATTGVELELIYKQKSAGRPVDDREALLDFFSPSTSLCMFETGGFLSGIGMPGLNEHGVLEAPSLSDTIVADGSLPHDSRSSSSGMDADDGFAFCLTQSAQDAIEASWPSLGWMCPIHMAAKKGHDRILRLLLDKDPDCNGKDSDGTTPLMLAVSGGYEDVTDTLLRHGARIAEVDNQQRSALHWAVANRREAVLRILLEHCAPDLTVINGYDNSGRTPLHMAVDIDFEAGVRLNSTVGGRLIRGAPLAQAACYATAASAASDACKSLQENWAMLDPFIADPVNVMGPYQQNNTCSPFLATSSGTCTLGSMSSYAINVSDAATVAAGVNFARKRNMRLVVKNTGHDFLGRSAGKGALALWTHNLKSAEVLNYTSSRYTGPAMRLGAGMQVLEIYKFAAAHGLRAVGGTCVTVGAMGGYTQGGGHGPLDASYGLGSDNVLEFDVVTMDGQHRTASPTQNGDLYWALAGGGAGNWAVVLSVTVRAHRDGPVAGARLSFARADLSHETYWNAVDAWFQHVATLDAQGLRGFRTMSRLTRSGFSLDMATLPGATAEELTTVLEPFYRSLEQLNVSLTTNEVSQQSNFLDHFLAYNTNNADTRNMTVGNRLIPRSLFHNATSLKLLTDALDTMVEKDNSTSEPIIVLLSSNVTHATAGNKPGDNSVLPAWRDSLFAVNLVLMSSERANWDTLASDLALMNSWQDRLRDITPGGGSYASEATFDNPNWKTDYYGDNYPRLLTIKQKYDPGFVLWNQPAVGSDAFRLGEDGRLYAV